MKQSCRILPHRDYSIYYSDQLQVLAETESFYLALLTDNIAVVHEDLSDGTVLEYEIVLFMDRAANVQYLLNNAAQLQLVVA